MKKILTSLLLLGSILMASKLYAQFEQKDLYNKWKLIKTEEGGKTVPPIHEQLIVEINKDKSFTISAALEETHSGTWEMSEDGKTLKLEDPTRDYSQELSLLDLDKTHLAVGNYDSKDVQVFFIPLGKSKNAKLNHVEHSLAKKWTCFESEKEANVGLVLEFKEDYTFIMVPYGSKLPVASGNWKLNPDKTKVLIDRVDGGHMELTIVERHSHELVLKSDDTGMINHFHDPKRTLTDVQNGVIFKNKNKQQHEEVEK